MRFEWDVIKDQSNFEKHAVWFEEAETLWGDAHRVILFDRDHSVFEDRYLAIGHSARGRILLVVFHERLDEAIRIISARKATQRERYIYEEGI